MVPFMRLQMDLAGVPFLHQMDMEKVMHALQLEMLCQ